MYMFIYIYYIGYIYIFQALLKEAPVLPSTTFRKGKSSANVRVLEKMEKSRIRMFKTQNTKARILHCTTISF